MTNSENRWISADPSIRAGLYRDLDQVPDHQRLRIYANSFEGQDCWSEWMSTTDLKSNSIPEQRRQELERTERRWKSFIRGCGVHHALCTPSQADAYATHVREEYELSTSTASEYWTHVERFYRWMFHHAEFPHRYHPFVMAAVNFETSRELWDHAIQTK